MHPSSIIYVSQRQLQLQLQRQTQRHQHDAPSNNIKSHVKILVFTIVYTYSNINSQFLVLSII